MAHNPGTTEADSQREEKAAAKRRELGLIVFGANLGASATGMTVVSTMVHVPIAVDVPAFLAAALVTSGVVKNRALRRHGSDTDLFESIGAMAETPLRISRCLKEQVTRLREGRQPEYEKAKRAAIVRLFSGRKNAETLSWIAERNGEKAPERRQRAVNLDAQIPKGTIVMGEVIESLNPKPLPRAKSDEGIKGRIVKAFRRGR
jgi:hypothetical protein